MYRIRQFVSISCLTLPVLLTCFVIDAAADPLPGEIRNSASSPRTAWLFPREQDPCLGIGAATS